MAPSSSDLNYRSAQPNRSRHEDENLSDEKILDVLSSLEKDLDSLTIFEDQELEDQELEDCQQDTLNQSRTIFMPTVFQLRKKQLRNLLTLYAEDQSMVSKVLPILEAYIPDFLGTPQLQNLPRSALREMLQG